MDTSNVALIDASAIVALVDAGDAAHGPALQAYRELLREGYRLFTTNYQVAEAYELLRLGCGPDIARRWLSEMRIPVYHADEADERRARLRVLAVTGRGISLSDAVSSVVMERFAITSAFAVDPNAIA